MKNLLKSNILSIMEIVKYQLKSQQAPNDDKRAIYSNQAMDSFESQTYSYK